MDDIFVVVEDKNHLFTLQTEFIRNSLLNYMHEVDINKKIPFLDLLLDNFNDRKIITSVCTKPRNQKIVEIIIVQGLKGIKYK